MELILSNQERLTIEPMTEEDLDWVASLEEATFSMPWSKEAFREEIGLPDRLFVVAKLYAGTHTEEGAQCEGVGYSGMFLSFDEGEITNVAVNPEFRGRGIGYQMLDAQMKMAKERGASSFTLEVRTSNANAIHLYEKLGFVSEGVRKNFYQRPVEDALIMWKR